MNLDTVRSNCWSATLHAMQTAISIGIESVRGLFLKKSRMEVDSSSDKDLSAKTEEK